MEKSTVIKNSFIRLLLDHVIKGEFNKPHIFHYTLNSSVTIESYYSTMSELVKLGHVSDIFLFDGNNVNGTVLNSISFIPNDTLKEFSIGGGFK